MRIEDARVREKGLLDWGRNNFKNSPNQTLRYLNIILSSANINYKPKIKTEALVIKAAIFENLGYINYALKYNFYALGYARAIKDMNLEARALRQLANSFSIKNLPELSFRYNMKSLIICRSQKNLRGYTAALNNLGIDYKSMMDFRKAIALFQQSLMIKKFINDKKNITISYCLMGISYSSIGDYHRAYNCYRNGLKISTEINDLYGLSVCYGMLSELFFSIKEQGLATKYLYRSSVLKSRINNKIGIIDSKVLFGLMKEWQGNKLEALRLYKIANREYTQLNNTFGICNTYSKIANLYLGLNLYDSGIVYIRKSISFEEGKNLTYSLIEDYLIYSNLLIQKGAIDSSMQAIKKVSQLIFLSKNPLFESDMHKILSILYKKMGNHKASFEYFKSYHIKSQRILNENLYNTIVLNEQEIEHNHQSEKNRYKIVSISKDKDDLILKQNAQIEINKFIEFVLESSILILIFFVVIQQYYYRRLLKIQEMELIDFENFLKSSLSQERNVIAEYIHDFVGSDLNTLLLQSRIIERKSNSKISPEISKIKEAIFEALIKIDNIVWSLKKPSGSLLECFNQIEEYFRSTTTDYALSLFIEGPKEHSDYTIGSQLRRDIFLASKETLNNALKHSNATEIRLKLSFHFPEISIFISDNGIGFDSTKDYSGNGIRSRQKRVFRHNGEIEIDSKIGDGTSVKMKFMSQ